MLLSTIRSIYKIKHKIPYIFLMGLSIFYTTFTMCDEGPHLRSGYNRENKIINNMFTEKICVNVDNTLKARHKGCFLRPDSGPCRADIIQWYYDVRQDRCFRFFWGGCQGNGNKFETQEDCENYCKLNFNNPRPSRPHFCSVAFDYGSCFGFFHRWAWDNFERTCKRRLYSGCGGNQNNFQNRQECLNTCVKPPNNTLYKFYKKYTTCVPFHISDLQ